MDGTIEIITGRERRRRWSTSEKLRIVAETYEQGATVGDVAARHGAYRSLVFTWRARHAMACSPPRQQAMRSRPSCLCACWTVRAMQQCAPILPRRRYHQARLRRAR